MTQEEREQLQAVLDTFDRKEDECYEKIAFMEEHKFGYEKQAIDLKRQVWHECFRELNGTLCRMSVSNPESDERLLHYVFDTVAMLSRHIYFADQLWRKLPGREDTDRATVETAFLRYRLSGIDIFTMPRGCTWGAITTKENCEDNLQEFNDIWKDYGKWCYEQR